MPTETAERVTPRRVRLPDTIPASIRTTLTRALCKPRGLPPQMLPTITIEADGTEVPGEIGLRESTAFTRDDHDGMLLRGATIEHEGKVYRPSTLRAAGFARCSDCGRISTSPSMVGTQCRACAGLVIPWMACKSHPLGGWVKHGDGDIAFGLELEVELPDPQGAPNERAWVESLPYDKMPPLVWTNDGSLSYGVEFNSHPMTLPFIRANSDKLTRFFALLKERGARSYQEHNGNKESAAIHIHVSKQAFGDIKDPAFNYWLAAHADSIRVMGRRSQHNMDHWCKISDNTEIWNDRRMYLNMRDNTVEARGFSSKVLLEDPTALPWLCEWLLALAKATKTPASEWMGLSPAGLMEWAGFAPGRAPMSALADVAKWEARRRNIEWKDKKKQYIRDIQCRPVRLSYDFTDNEFAQLGISATSVRTIRASADTGRLLCIHQREGSDSMLYYYLQENGIPTYMHFPWYAASVEGLERPARTQPADGAL